MERTDRGYGARYSFADIFEALAGASQFEDILNRILTVCLRELEADQGSILLLDGEGNPQLRMLAAVGLPEEIVKRGYIARKGSISEHVLRELRPVVINDKPPVPGAFIPPDQTAVRRRIVSAMCVPLLARGQVLGTMNLNRTQGSRTFTDADMEACTVVASQAAIVIEHHRLQEELRQQERLAAVGQTVAGISHCVKNILSGVRGGLGLTEMGMQQKDENLQMEGFQLLKRSVSSLSSLVLDLLDYSKKREPLSEVFHVSPMIDQLCDTIGYKAAQQKVQVVREVKEGLTYCGDRDQLFRALLNIVTNAIDAAGSGCCRESQPRIVIRATAVTEEGTLPGENGIIFEVEDNGPGIPEEAQPHIWDIFFSTKGSKGTGLGLASARKVVEEHCGRIIMKTSPEWGTLFQILLPPSGGSETAQPHSRAAFQRTQGRL